MGGRGAVRAVGLAWRSGGHLVLAGAALAGLAAAVPVATAWLAKLALDAVVGRHAGPIAPVAGGLLAAGAFAALVPPASRYVRQELARRAGRLAQDRLFAATERFVGLARFEEPAFLDRLRLAMQAGGTAPGGMITGGLAVVSGAATVAGFLGSLLAVSPWMSLVVLVAALPVLAAELRISRRRAEVLWTIGPHERREIFYQQVLTSVQAAKELRLYGAGGYLRRLMGLERATADGQRRRLDRRELAALAATGLLTAGTAGGGLVWALLAARRGELSAGDVTLFLAAVAGVQSGVVGLVQEISLVHQQTLLFGHYLSIVDSPADLPVVAPARSARPLRRGIELHDVWFRYAPGQPWALRGLTLSIPHGATVGLVGRNGAGKSTIVKLLTRLYDPQRGAVTWDGVDLRELDPAELRQRIGVVFQDFMAYDLSASVNIGLGDVARVDDRPAIEAAARRAGVHDVLTALPKGYDTLLSRMFAEEDESAGTLLSGGQWQRLAIARAMLRGERDLLILDEPSSGLDPEAEYEIHAGLRAHRAGRTSLLVSHRLGAVRDADLLVVVDDGRVVEQGDHATLLGAGGRYARLFGLQARGYAEAVN